MMVLLTPHFSLAELTRTDTGLPNVPNQVMIATLTRTAQQMERVRSMLGGLPIHVDSAFRSDAVNRAVGGVPNSAHTLGYAVDFTCPAFGDPYKVASAIAGSKIPYDQLIHEKRVWVHVSFDPRYRGQRLTLLPDGSYANGIEATP